MSYIAFDLDALNIARDVGAAAGLPEEKITHGLLRLWAWCFRQKTDLVQPIQVVGFFGSDAAPALVAFGFLEVSGEAFRVRGASRYLRILDARSRGGKAAAGNLKRGSTRATASREVSRGSSRGLSRETAGTQPGISSGSVPALTPNTDDLIEKHLSKPAAPTDETPSRASDLLCADFLAVIGSAYRFQGAKDGKALAELLKSASLDEVRARWRRGLQAPSTAWASCRTIAQLASKWNDLATAAPSKPLRPDADTLRIL